MLVSRFRCLYMLYWYSFPMWNKKDRVMALLLFAYTYMVLFELKYYITGHSWKLCALF